MISPFERLGYVLVSDTSGIVTTPFRMRILIATLDFPPATGGIQTYAGELSKRLAAHASRCVVVAPHHPGAHLADPYHPCEVIRVRTSSDAFPLRAAWPLSSLIRSVRPDVVLAAQWAAAWPALAFRTQRGPRVVIAAHGRELLLRPFNQARRLQSLYDRARRTALARADAVAAVSRFTAACVRSLGVPAQRVHVVNNGVDPTRFCPGPPSRSFPWFGHGPIALTVARLVPRKGIDTTLHAFANLLPEMPSARYIVAGSGPDLPRLVALARDLRIDSQVRFLGRVGDDMLPDLYRSCDVFVMPSRSEPPDVEGFGLSLLEASACGKPVIAARSGGMEDAVVHGTTGWLVPPSDPVALADRLAAVFADPGAARTLGEAGRAHVVQRGAWDHVASRLVELFHGIAT